MVGEASASASAHARVLDRGGASDAAIQAGRRYSAVLRRVGTGLAFQKIIVPEVIAAGLPKKRALGRSRDGNVTL
jgi:hypothetical protein